MPRKHVLKKAPQILREYRRGASAQELAEKYGFNEGSIRRIVKRFNPSALRSVAEANRMAIITGRSRRKITKEKELVILSGVAKGKKFKDIGSDVGVHPDSIRSLLKKKHLETYKRHIGKKSNTYWNEHPQARGKIKAAHKKGTSINQLSKKYKTGWLQIRKIVDGEYD